jgi:hypothetical protein
MPEEDEMTETSIWSTWTENTHHALLYIHSCRSILLEKEQEIKIV